MRKRAGCCLPILGIAGFGLLAAMPLGAYGAIDNRLMNVVAPEPKVQPVEPSDNGRVSVLVHLQPGLDRTEVRGFAAGHGGHVRYEYKILSDVINLRGIPAEAVDKLRNLPGVVKVEEDTYGIRINLHDSTPLINGLQSQITAAGYSADGAGVRVCICDTGIDTDHVMYADRIDAAAGRDFYNDDTNPEDDQGHGSHVAGIAVGGTGLSVDFGCDGSEPFQGVAPEATLIGVKILNQFGGGFDSDIIAGIDYCADQSTSGGRADVINLSIGKGQFSGHCDTDNWATAANNAVSNGVVVVAASGNENYSNALSSPACGSSVISVGATYDANFPNCEDGTTTFNWGNCLDSSPDVDQVVCFSNESDNLDVSAPGSVIYSASRAAGGNSITGMSGTSMACPHVVGLAALLLGEDPSLTPAEVRQLIRDGAVDLGTPGFDRGYGYGRINVTGTLALLTPESCGNGNCGSGEDSCTCPQDCGNPPASETVCTDGLDNDCDTLIDCADSNCAADAACICDADGNCEGDEDCNNCANDCIGGGGPGCGNGVCEPSVGEDCLSCAADCAGKQTGSVSKRYCCGDGAGTNPVGCADARCTADPFECSDVPSEAYCCGDGVCEGAEDACSCALDCESAPATEGSCTDGADADCDGLTDCEDADCAADAACQPPACDNDSLCEPGEDCLTCPGDCAGVQSGKPSNRYCCGNGLIETPEGNGTICDGNY